MLKTISESTSAEIVEKKSKFIANLYYITSEQEAKEKIKEIRKQYYDAKHHCYAYCIKNKNGIISKMSDDGEPNGTAGMPMLNILQKQELVNVLIVVTRYFGGILLGTGGLLKAYSEVTLEAIKKAEIMKEEIGYEVEIKINYPNLEKFQYYCKKNAIRIEKIQYEEKINCKIELTKEEKEKMTVLKEEGNLKILDMKIIKEKNIRKNIEKYIKNTRI